MTVLPVDTPHGPANVHLHPADEPRAALVEHLLAGELRGLPLVAPTLVVQGEHDPFGVPPAAARRAVVLVAGDHSLRTGLAAVTGAVRGWLHRLLDQAAATPI